MSVAINHAPDPQLQSGGIAATYSATSTSDDSATPSRRERSDGDENPDSKRARIAGSESEQIGAGQPDQHGNHADGSWTCPHCGNVNWPRRTVCNNKRCMRPKVEGATGPMDASTPPGSWVCPLCQNINWPKRTSCNRCKASKGAVMGNMPMMPIGAPRVSVPEPFSPQHKQHPDGSWVCPTCGNVNWPKRMVCNRKGCETARPPEPPQPAMTGIGDINLRTQMQALHMLAMQDPANANVYRAQLEQLQLASQITAGMISGATMAASAGARGGRSQHPEGSWECPNCKNINWPKRTVCNRAGCSTARPDNPGIPPSQEIGGANAHMPVAAVTRVGGYPGNMTLPGGGGYAQRRPVRVCM